MQRRPVLSYAAAVFALAAFFAFPPSVAAYTDYDSPFGINAGLFSEADAAGIEALGAKWVRCDFHWSWIESEGKGIYNWETDSRWDDMMASAAAHNLHTLGVVGYSPNWATSYPYPDDPEPGAHPNHFLPANLSDYKDFVRAVVERYDGDGVDDGPGSHKVDAWELWNEPDINFCNCEPEEYAKALTAGYEGVMEADPDAVVLMGGLSRGGIDGDFTDRLLDALLDAGGAIPFQIINNHNYHGVEQIVQRTQRHQSSFLSRGLTLPYWYTEGSIQAGSAGEEPVQAAGVVKSYALFFDVGVSKFFWYMWGHTINDYVEGFFYGDGTKKMGYYAYRNMVDLVQPREYDPSLKIIAPEFEQYGFSDATGATGTLYAIWSADETAHDVELTFPSSALDFISATGAATRIEPNEAGAYELTVDWMPFYLREVDDGAAGPAIRAPVANGAISDNTPTVRWDERPGAASYKLQIGQDPAFAPGSFQEYGSIAGTSRALDPPLADGQWRARVVAVDGDGAEIYGQPTAFVVDATPPPAPAVNSIYPQKLAFDGSNIIEFNEEQDGDIVQFNIYRSKSLKTLGDTIYSTVEANEGNYYDRFGLGLEDQVWYYQITATDGASPPNESEPSNVYLIYYKVNSRLDDGWNLFSFPGDPPEQSTFSPLAYCSTGVSWQNGAIEAYSGDIYSLNPSLPYWLYNAGYAPGPMTGSGPIVNPAPYKTFALSPGWNLIPNPYPAPLPWSDEGGRVGVRAQGGGGLDVSLELAVHYESIRGDVYYYESGAYQAVAPNRGQSVPPFRPFWIYAIKEKTLVVYAP